ncbi:uncharacterized protein LOC127706620 [Mytilus californianus]|uniref:uncharacterized protein LOC127706620 n=1 Tax=Mytilus californianus TaxID=6549 RepID=UPI00224852BF|nr:uncharacterized protein LOC127706620 [Mytilus californianus]
MYFIKIDPCKSTLTIGIENMWFKQSLIEFKFGERNEFYVKGTLGMEYIVEELQSSKEYLVSVNISVCFEPNKSKCYIQRPIAKDLLISKPQCNWNMDFKTPGFSLKSWMQSNQFSIHNKLPVYANYLLMEKLGVSNHLLKQSCHQNRKLEQMTVNRWIEECPLTIVKPQLQNGVTCTLTHSCTGVECCLDVELIDRSIFFKLDLDPCNHILLLSIENLSYNISLFNFDWGRDIRFSLENVFRIDYSIYDLSSSRLFQIDMNISACFETTGSCMFSQRVLTKTLLVKKPCEWVTGFVNANFSVGKWKADNNLQDKQYLHPTEILRLTEALGIKPFLQKDKCDKYREPYSKNIQGFSSGCNEVLRTITIPQDVVCHVGELCTEISCCTETEIIARTLETKLIIDPCDFKLTIAIERLLFEVDLFHFEWGHQKQFDLYGVMEVS